MRKNKNTKLYVAVILTMTFVGIVSGLTVFGLKAINGIVDNTIFYTTSLIVTSIVNVTWGSILMSKVVDKYFNKD